MRDVSMRRTIVYRREGETAFLNVDVDVRSRKPLEPLVAAFTDKVSLHYIGRQGRKYWAHFAPYSPKSPEAAIRALAAMVGRLPGAARRLWDGADERVFDIGIQAGLRPHNGEYQLSDASVALIARLGGSIKVTVYAAEIPAAPSLRGGRGRPTMR
jgi:hypothetical protein